LFLPMVASAQNTIPQNQKGDEKGGSKIQAISLPKDTVDEKGVKTAKQLKQEAAAAKKAAQAKPEDPVVTELISANKTAEFIDKARFTFTVKNNTANVLEGKVAYQVFTMTGEKLNKDSITVKVGLKEKKGFDFE